MRVELIAVTKGRAERALPPTSLTFCSGESTLATVETEQRPTVLGLIASGRMRPDRGTVSYDGASGPRAAAHLRRKVALVDAIGVSEPEPNVTVAGVVAEELMFAGSAPNPFAARSWLDAHGLGHLAGAPIGTIAPAFRFRILLELAVLRQGVAAVVLVSPDRHGGEPEVWWTIGREFAGRGFAVLVIAGRASRTALRNPHASSDTVEPLDPAVAASSDAQPTPAGSTPSDPSPAAAHEQEQEQEQERA